MPAVTERVITVFGGTGFLGRRVVRRALEQGWMVRVAARRPDVPPTVGDTPQPEPVAADIRDPEAVAIAVRGADAVVNTVSLYVQDRKSTFETTHVIGAGHVAQASKHAAARLVHLSGIGVDRKSRSPYVRARALGEERVLDAYPESSILRPSAMFGPGDALLSTMTSLIHWLPAIPLFGEGDSRIQPVHVDDVARAVLAAVERPDARGVTFELGGPDVYTYRELYEALARRLGRRRWFVPVSFRTWNVIAALAAIFPGRPLTRDQLELVRRDNMVRIGKTFADLGIDAKSLAHAPAAVEPG